MLGNWFDNYDRDDPTFSQRVEMRSVAHAWLAEHDETPLDRGHIVAAGLKQDYEEDGQWFPVVGKIAVTKFRDGWEAVLADTDGDIHTLCPLSTRGQLLALLRGLGVSAPHSPS